MQKGGHSDDFDSDSVWEDLAFYVIQNVEISLKVEKKRVSIVRVKEFRDTLRGELERVAKEEGKSFDNNHERGVLFQEWVLNLFIDRFASLSVDRSSSYEGKDSGVDVFFDDTYNKKVILIQTKYVGGSKSNKYIKREEVDGFFQVSERFKDEKYIRNHINRDVVRECAQIYRETVLKRKGEAEFWFISTGQKSDEIEGIKESWNKSVGDSPIKYEVLDLHELAEFYNRAKSLEADIPAEVSIPIGRREIMIQKKPHPSVLIVLPGTIIRDFYLKHKESLFISNIRDYLGNRGLNKSIGKTAYEEPENFYYFNNGVSAICEKLHIEDSAVKAEKFQIINGAQTISAIATRASDASLREIKVIMKLTETKKVAQQEQFAAQIIRYNNSQNIIKESDFRSNDSIQIWLQDEFKKVKPKDHIRAINYIRRRGQRQSTKKGDWNIKLEEFAKIRYAYLCYPEEVNKEPRLLWTNKAQDENGKYGDAFGVDGGECDSWSPEVLDEAVVIIVADKLLEKEMRGLAKIEEDGAQKYKGIFRFKFFALRLFKKYVDIHSPDMANLRRGGKEFKDFFDNFWIVAGEILKTFYDDEVNTEGNSQHSICRSGEEYKKLESKFKSSEKMARESAKKMIQIAAEKNTRKS